MSGPQSIINERYRAGWDKAFAKKMAKKHGPKTKSKLRKPVKRSPRSRSAAHR